MIFRNRILNRRRFTATALVFSLLVVVASSCNRATDDTPGGQRADANATTNKAAATATPQAQKPAENSADAAARSLHLASTTPFAPGVLDTEIQGVDGKPFRLADYKGKVVVLDLWATWCGPCRAEIPHLNEIQKQYQSRGLEVVGLTNEDPEEDAEAVDKFAREMKINYKLGWATQTLWISLGRANSIPQTYILGRDGRPVRFFAGYSPRNRPDGDSDHVATPERMQKAIEQALASAESDD
ncbi:MAG TPA: TlpA disulfide reductase family protein [Pyrinomonadaceae bacterium]|nr:TlpA disulfide reductase family protein [Pyrinomonadaceae bacterium]